MPARLPRGLSLARDRACACDSLASGHLQRSFGSTATAGGIAAKPLGLTIPLSLLLRADQVIE